MQQKPIKQLLLLVSLAIGMCIAAEARAVTMTDSPETKISAPAAPSTPTEDKPVVSKADAVATPKAEDKTDKADTTDIKTENTNAENVKTTKALPATSEKAESTTTTAVPAQTITAPVAAPASPAAATTLATASDQMILTLAKQVSTAAFNYDYKNYQQQFDGMAKYFTPEGWVAFSDALKRSNNIEEVKKDQITVNSKVEGEAKIVKQEVIKGSKILKVEVPLLVSYKGITQNIQQNLLIEVVIVPVAPSISPEGVAVTQFIAKATAAAPSA